MASLRTIICAALLMLSACDQQSSEPLGDKPSGIHEEIESASKNAESSRLWSQLIAYHDEGWHSRSAAVSLHFRRNVEVSKEKLQELIKVSPDVPFSVELEDQKRIKIKPRTVWGSGEEYRIELTPGLAPGLAPGLLAPELAQGNNDNISSFYFGIKIIEQDYSLRLSGLSPSPRNNKMQLVGSVETADHADLDDIENSIRVEHLGKQLPMVWSHEANKKLHQFTVKNIARSNNQTRLDIEYSAESLGLNISGRESVQVPPIRKFEVTGQRVHQGAKRYIDITFSEPLDRKQNLSGLVLLNNEPTSARINGSKLQIFPEKSTSGDTQIQISHTIRSALGKRLGEAFNAKILLAFEKPGVRFVDEGSIIPNNPEMAIPFEAVNITAVNINAYKVFDNNLQHYIQNYKLNSHVNSLQLSRKIWQQRFILPSLPSNQWTRYSLDIKQILEKHSDGIIHLKLDFEKKDVMLDCAKALAIDETQNQRSAHSNHDKRVDGPGIHPAETHADWFSRLYGDNNGYVRYSERQDPCNEAYYRYTYGKHLSDARNFMLSNIGVMAKQGATDDIHIVTTALDSGKAMAKVAVTTYNYQNQEISRGTSDAKGQLILKSEHPAFYLIARKGNSESFLRFPKNEALPTNQFDVGGKKSSKGIRGFVYAERDIWRPGDQIFLSFILQDSDQRLPENHPVSVDIFDPRGQKFTSLQSTTSKGNIYNFDFRTNENSPTGSWRAVVWVGDAYFDKQLKVETISPNRLKVDLSLADEQEILNPGENQFLLTAQWLHGAKAAGLRTDTKLMLRPSRTTFDSWQRYVFDDPASNFSRWSEEIHKGKLDDEGSLHHSIQLPALSKAPGVLNANFVTRIFEPSGQFSTSINRRKYSPHKSYVGLHVPEGGAYRGAIARDKDHPVHLLSVDPSGKPLPNQRLEFSIYKMDWRWWWDQNQENLANYVRDAHRYQIASSEIDTDEHGKATWTLKKNSYTWGRHLLRVCNKSSGHCSGTEVYLGWSWRNQTSPDSASQLVLATHKPQYTVGEKAIISLPDLVQGEVFYSIETSNKIVKQGWVPLEQKNNFTIALTKDMSPNVYVYTMVVLPHEKRESDAPIRMYGIVPVLVDDPSSQLTPTLNTPAKVKPKETFFIDVSEKDGREMHYTLAIVDEGLLGITNFSTPDPHHHFYQRQALGVYTWDNFDSVLGAYNANLQTLLKVGGGSKSKDAQEHEQRRFPPVVKFLGTFHLPAAAKPLATTKVSMNDSPSVRYLKGSNRHRVELPPYLGEVRAMVVAAQGQRYGHSAASIQVSQALNVITTLPRSLRPNETLAMPIHVFANEDSISKVNLQVSSNAQVKVEQASKTLHFAKPGDMITSLPVRVEGSIGKGRVTVQASAGSEVSEETIHIDVLPPNDATTRTQSRSLQPGETWKPDLEVHGMQNTNISNYSVSRLPPMDLSKRLDYLIRYPHGCVEQTTSAIFPQIVLHRLVDLNVEQRERIQEHFNQAIQKLRFFLNRDGSFSYWPGGEYSNFWSSIYVTHFLQEANAQGYAVPKDILDSALEHLTQKVKQRELQTNHRPYTDAYALMVLSNSGQAEVAAMNRLREFLLNTTAPMQLPRMLLSQAYAAMGLQDIAHQLCSQCDADAITADAGRYTYGSPLRNQSIALMSLISLKKSDAAYARAEKISKRLSQAEWLSTHTTAWAIIALSKFAGEAEYDSAFQFSVKGTEPGKRNSPWQNMQSTTPVFSRTLATTALKEKLIEIRNDSDGVLHAQVSNRGVAPAGEDSASPPPPTSPLTMQVKFEDLNGQALDVESLQQGQDFVAVVNVRASNSNQPFVIENIALSMIMPSGWQITNDRLASGDKNTALDYQDIRDDRVLSYFSLWRDRRPSYRYKQARQSSVEIRVNLNASFAGRFYMPDWHVSAMYDNDIRDHSKGKWVRVLATDSSESGVNGSVETASEDANYVYEETGHEVSVHDKSGHTNSDYQKSDSRSAARALAAHTSERQP